MLKVLVVLVHADHDHDVNDDHHDHDHGVNDDDHL